MKFFPDKVLIGTIFLVILAISAVVFLYYRQSEKAQETAASVAHTNEVLYHSSKALASIREHVLRARAFGLSGDSSYLRRQKKAENEIYNQLSYLRRLSVKNEQQQNRIDSLSVYIDKRVEFSNKLINIRLNNGRDSAVRFISDNEGLAYLDNIRLITSQIEDEANTLLQKQKGRSRNEKFNLDIVLVVIVFFILVLIFFMIQKVKSDISNFRKSEAELRYNAILIGNISDAVVSTDKDLKIKTWNKSAEKMYGWTESEVLGKTAPDVFNVIYPQSSEKRVIEEFYASSHWQGEVIHHKKNGEPFPVHIVISHISDENKKEAGTVAVIRDISLLKQAQSERAIRESDERTRMIINSALDAIICMDTQGYITVWNPRAEKMFGWTAEEVMGRKLTDLIVPERYRKKHEQGVKRYLETGETRLMNRVTQINALRRDGAEFHIELTVIDIKQPGKNSFCAFIRDITDRVEAETALKESEELYRLIVETANEGIWMIDENDQTTYVNEQMARMLGYEREEMIGRSMYHFVASELKKRAGENLERRKTGVSEHHEFVFEKRDGSFIQALLGITPIIMDGEYKGALAMVVDITERKLADQRIQREKELSDSIINSLPGIFYFFDFNGKFLKWNKNFESLSGYTAEEISNMTPHDFFVGADKEHIKRAIQKAFLSGYADTEANFMSRNGIGYITYFSGRRIDVDGQPCLIGMGIDISDLKKAQNELQVLTAQLRKLSSHLQEVREEERSMIAKEIHDELGQQLTSLKMDVSWLKKIGEFSVEEVSDRVTSIHTLLDTTINTVRRISSDLRPGMLDDLGLVDTLEWQSLEFAKRFGISVHFDSDDPDVLLPSSISLALFRVFQESLTNIARHANATRVDAFLHISEDEIQLSVSDNGVGFDASEVTAKRTLGLVGMRERLLAIDGSFEVISDPGKGTTIFVTVPFNSNNF